MQFPQLLVTSEPVIKFKVATLTAIKSMGKLPCENKDVIGCKEINVGSHSMIGLRPSTPRP